jgi:hypothetical protein
MENRFNPTNRNYTKTNFVELLELITPDVYIQEDGDLSGYGLNPISEVINSHLNVGANIDSILSISSVNGSQTQNINNISGISQYFVKQNQLTNITPYSFEKNILVPLGTTLKNFESKEEFRTYLSGTLLPQIHPEQSTAGKGTVVDNRSVLRPLVGGISDASAIHNFLIDTLGWFYFLNTSADGSLTFDPSTLVTSSLGDLYEGRTLTTLDGVLGLTDYLWRNYETCSFGQFGVIPTAYVSGAADAIVDASAGKTATYTSGIQKLENLKTLIEIVYSQSYMDNEDYRVKDAFDNYIAASTKLNDLTAKGPFRKFLNAFGFELADRTDEIEQIQLLYDIENCPQENLKRIADLIGWRLYGNSPSKWRHQLRSAVEIYKRKGTLDAIQYAINALVINTALDVSSKVQELHESYLPQLIWYALGTESEYFLNLNTWTPDKANEAGIFQYDSSSIENNLKLAVDHVLLELYDYFPESFVFKGEKFPTYDFYTLDIEGNLQDKYTTIIHPNTLPFYMLDPQDPTYDALFQDALAVSEGPVWEAATFEGPLGFGTYFAGEFNQDQTVRPTYLSAVGDLTFMFNYRGRQNYPLPPFEEVKYYEDCLVTPQLVERLVERLKCLGVRRTFADDLKNFLIDSAVTTSGTLGDLNNFLMLFDRVQVPPNFNSVLENIDKYYTNLLPLWNGKSSHLFVNFSATDFDFTKTTIEGDSRYAVTEASRIINEFSPAHAIPRVVVDASSAEDYVTKSAEHEYLGFDKDEVTTSFSGAFANYESSGQALSFTIGGGDGNQDSDGGRGGLNTFKRSDVDSLVDTLFSSTASITDVPRRSHRRRNFKYVLPRDGYYDRTGFNGPVSFDSSVLENSFASSMGEFVLGYVASAGKFHPIDDPIDPTGVWHECEDLGSTRAFSGIDTSNTFPFRGLSSLGSNEKFPEILDRTDRYNDRGQLPDIYKVMHRFFDRKAYDYALENFDTTYNSVWKDEYRSFANEAIASGLVLNSFDDYLNFSFGTGFHKVHRDYAKYFDKHALGANEIEKTGGNVFAHVFGKGLFNCDFGLDGSAPGQFINTTVSSVQTINTGTVLKEGEAGTVSVSNEGEAVIPLSGTYTFGKEGNTEFRNRSILSGIEFVDASGNTSANSFSVFRLDASNSSIGSENALIDNTIIKFKTAKGLPRIRFDLSSVGDRRNYFIKDHKFRLDISALVAEENSPILGGGQIGVWIHTSPASGYVWSWTKSNSWVPTLESDLSVEKVRDLSLITSFPTFDPPENSTTVSSYDYCLETFVGKTIQDPNEISLGRIKKDFFSKLSFEFDTRNYSIHNNKEYLSKGPYNIQSDDLYSLFEMLHQDDTNYTVEIYFLPNSANKYMLVDQVGLQDLTLRDHAGIPTGHGTETSGWPLRKFVKEDKLFATPRDLKDILKFYNGLAGLDSVYKSKLNSRDATLTSGTLEVSGGSRLNYRLHPEWGTYVKDGTYSHYTSLEFDN